MKITNVRNLYSYIPKGRLIGYGRTAFCYKLSDNRLLKAYIESGNKRNLFKKYNMVEHLELLNDISNDTFIGPEEVLVRDGEVLAYIYPFIKGVTVKSIRGNTKLSSLTNNFNKLIEDTIEISEKRFELRDVHNENILFDGNNYYVIDLDEGRLSEREDPNMDILYNTKEVTNTIINSYFRGDNKHIIKWYDPYIDKVYRSVRWTDEESYNSFFKALSDKCRVEDPSLNTIRRRVKTKMEINDYKNFY